MEPHRCHDANRLLLGSPHGATPTRIKQFLSLRGELFSSAARTPSVSALCALPSRLPFSAPGSRLPPRSLLLPAAKVATGDPQPRSLLRFARCPLDTRNLPMKLRRSVAAGRARTFCFYVCVLMILFGGLFHFNFTLSNSPQLPWLPRRRGAGGQWPPLPILSMRGAMRPTASGASRRAAVG